MVQSTRSTYDPKFPWLGLSQWLGADPGEEGEGDKETEETEETSETEETEETVPETVSKADYEALLKRMQAADRSKSEAEKKLREAADKEKTELQIAQRDRDEASQRVTAMENDLKQARLQNAFLADNSYDWHSPSKALALVDLAGVEIGDDGKVTGLTDALKALAKSDPYLVKAKDGGGGGGNGGTGSGSDGRGGSNKKATEDQLKAKYAALRR